MSANKVTPPRRSGSCYVAAVVLGTALTALGPATTLGAPLPETTARAVTDLSRYCTACWRNARLPADCWGDCTQEVFRRLLERVPTDAWARVLGSEGEERKEFVRAIDAVKKRTQRSRKWAPGPVDQTADERDLHRRNLAGERELVETAAGQVLSPRQQRILRLSFEGWTVQEIAEELKTAPARVSDEKYKAVRKLRDHFHPGVEAESSVSA